MVWEIHTHVPWTILSRPQIRKGTHVKYCLCGGIEGWRFPTWSKGNGKRWMLWKRFPSFPIETIELRVWHGDRHSCNRFPKRKKTIQLLVFAIEDGDVWISTFLRWRILLGSVRCGTVTLPLVSSPVRVGEILLQRTFLDITYRQYVVKERKKKVLLNTS